MKNNQTKTKTMINLDEYIDFDTQADTLIDLVIAFIHKLKKND